MKIKVCGLKDPENVKAVAVLNPDYMGFIFYNGTPRFVDDLSPEALETIPASINKTAVFVNEDIKTISRLLDQYEFDFVQLHGNETPAFCKTLREQAIVIKAFGIDNDFDFKQLDKYKNKVDLFLFDTKTKIHGGSGIAFDWNVLDKYEMDIPFFLSGGLSLDNLDAIKSIYHPQFYGVDLNSKFEVSPGIKDLKKLQQAFDIIKQNID
jgi:phosphoribosylanthranilate isomerase